MSADAYQPFVVPVAAAPTEVVRDAADGFDGLAAARFTRFRDDRAQTLATLAALAAPGASQIPWIEGLERLRRLPVPTYLDAAAWDRIVWTALQLHEQWGEQAHAAGWNMLELFGANPVRTIMPNDKDGLTLALCSWDGPIRVSAIERDHIDLMAIHGSIVRWRRFDRSGSIPMWEAFGMPTGP